MNRENTEVLCEDWHFDSGECEVVNPNTRPESLRRWLVEFFMKDRKRRLSRDIVYFSLMYDELVHWLRPSLIGCKYSERTNYVPKPTLSSISSWFLSTSELCSPSPFITCSVVSTVSATEKIYVFLLAIGAINRRFLLTIASTIHASSNPALFDITSRVKRRKKTTRPETSVKASTMILTRIPAGVGLSVSMMTEI